MQASKSELDIKNFAPEAAATAEEPAKPEETPAEAPVTEEAPNEETPAEEPKPEEGEEPPVPAEEPTPKEDEPVAEEDKSDAEISEELLNTVRTLLGIVDEAPQPQEVEDQKAVVEEAANRDLAER
jgi:hypothetical protein